MPLAALKTSTTSGPNRTQSRGFLERSCPLAAPIGLVHGCGGRGLHSESPGRIRGIRCQFSCRAPARTKGGCTPMSAPRRLSALAL